MSAFSAWTGREKKPPANYEIIPPGESGDDARRREQNFRVRSAVYLGNGDYTVMFGDRLNVVLFAALAAYFAIGSVVGLLWPLFVFT